MVRNLLEQYRDKRKNLKVSMGVMWKYLEFRGVHIAYIMTIKDMYNGVKTLIRLVRDNLEIFYP